MDGVSRYYDSADNGGATMWRDSAMNQLNKLPGECCFGLYFYERLSFMYFAIKSLKFIFFSLNNPSERT